jgi:Zn-dependent protease with chaperone function
MNRGNISLSILFMFLAITCLGQYERNYKIRKISSANSTGMIQRLEDMFDTEKKTDFKDYQRDPIVQTINIERLTALKKSVKQGYFLEDDTLQQFVSSVLQRIVQANSLNEQTKRHSFIADNAARSASCHGKGIFIVNVGLLAAISEEDQLAFVLAHEIAHDELGHTRQKILLERNMKLQAKSKKFTKQVFSYNQDIDLEELEEYRNTAYYVMRHSRTAETQADSLGLLYLSRAGYQKKGALEVLELLKEKDKPKYEIGIDFFLPFDSPQYPFQTHWLNEKPGIYNASRKGGTNVFSYDSLLTHPDLKRRQAYLDAANYEMANYTPGIKTNPLESIAVSELQIIHSSLRAGKFDLTLYYAMQMLKKHPNNAFVISRIGVALLNSLLAKDSNVFRSIVSPYTGTYNEEQRLMNNFLYNLERKELGEVAYHFMKRSDHFDSNERSHYYLLWRFCDLTYRYDEKNSLAKVYNSKFKSDISAFSFKKQQL